MSKLKTDKKFKTTLDTLVKKFHEDLHMQGYKLTLSKLIFQAREDSGCTGEFETDIWPKSQMFKASTR